MSCGAPHSPHSRGSLDRTWLSSPILGGRPLAIPSLVARAVPAIARLTRLRTRPPASPSPRSRSLPLPITRHHLCQSPPLPPSTGATTHKAHPSRAANFAGCQCSAAPWGTLPGTRGGGAAGYMHNAVEKHRPLQGHRHGKRPPRASLRWKWWRGAGEVRPSPFSTARGALWPPRQDGTERFRDFQTGDRPLQGRKALPVTAVSHVAAACCGPAQFPPRPPPSRPP